VNFNLHKKEYAKNIIRNTARYTMGFNSPVELDDLVPKATGRDTITKMTTNEKNQLYLRPLSFIKISGRNTRATLWNKLDTNKSMIFLLNDSP
jgi:hypothetical protein